VLLLSYFLGKFRLLPLKVGFQLTHFRSVDVCHPPLEEPHEVCVRRKSSVEARMERFEIVVGFLVKTEVAQSFGTDFFHPKWNDVSFVQPLEAVSCVRLGDRFGKGSDVRELLDDFEMRQVGQREVEFDDPGNLGVAVVVASKRIFCKGKEGINQFWNN